MANLRRRARVLMHERKGHRWCRGRIPSEIVIGGETTLALYYCSPDWLPRVGGGSLCARQIHEKVSGAVQGLAFHKGVVLLRPQHYRCAVLN